MAGRLAIQIGDEGGANYYEGAAHTDAIVFYMPLSHPDSIRLNGHQFDRSSLGAIRENGSIEYSAKTANRFAAVVLPSYLFRNTDRFDAKEAAVLEASNSVLTVDPRRLALLRRMVQRFAAIKNPLSVAAERIDRGRVHRPYHQRSRVLRHIHGFEARPVVGLASACSAQGSRADRVGGQ